MIIVMQAHTTDDSIQAVVQFINQKGLKEHISRGTERTIIGAMGDERVFDAAEIEQLPQVERAINIVHEWRMVSKEAALQNTEITVRGVTFGGNTPIKHIGSLKTDDAILLDPFYLPSNPYLFSGCKTEKEISNQISLHHQNNQPVIIKIHDSKHIQATFNMQADMIYIGGDLVENRYVLHELGSLNIPVIVCKHATHTVKDWLLAAEQIVLRGNQHVILGDAGTLNPTSEMLRLDVDATVAAKQLSHLPVLADIRLLAHHFMPQETLIQLATIAGVDMIAK
ncbi:3-deoxy-D-arabino-heptulosonate 7-phosphate synthase [Kingella negevensis]|uniref:3-deoxy-D-arabino-heptulosonate 7-phosphate synthase n=1 Tax=Kingella negevensis TaxID=1522312 RepID=UPI00254AB923|nr:3-deoxy-D-arabino-heptulosonate 7-phosphate synthase [Kingella negevensis]MDK4707712.1 3-deoxy-D-arabino-heptulosonate 7-phosphate synthase [Kingella negevensis]MDK4709852.1 3-deoxy-D-arabino-heptulosonate 7-phosphate synthase [Kingella negevensis]